MSESVKCPYCGEERGDLWDIFSGSSDDEEVTVECYNCEKEYKIIRYVSIEYSTDPDPDFEEYLDRHPEERKRINEHKARMKAIISEGLQCNEKIRDNFIMAEDKKIPASL